MADGDGRIDRSAPEDGQATSDFWNAVKSQLYTEPAPVPVMLWKSAPASGILSVTVSKPGRPSSTRVATVAGGQVLREDFDLSDADHDSHAAMDD